jgi:multidrug efflux system membrane fusion protein
MKLSTTVGPKVLEWVAVFALAALGACGGGTKDQAQTAETVTGLRTQTLRVEVVPDELEAPGTIRSATTATLAARVMGTVMEVRVREGDAVKRGQVLVVLDERELEARHTAARAAREEAKAGIEAASHGLAVAQAQAEVAAKTFERFQFLKQQKSVSPQEFDEVAAKHRAAQAGLATAKARVDQVEAASTRAGADVRVAETMAGYARIVAPFDGIVVRRSVEPGMMAAPGTPLVEMEMAGRYRLETTVPASAAAARKLKRGTRARVRLDALPGQEFEGTIVELEAGADASSRTVLARVELQPTAAGLRSGFFGRAFLCCAERDALVLPRAALVERGQLRGVYVAGAGGVLRFRLVTLGQSVAGPDGERLEVLSGLDAGEAVVLNPGTRNLDGKRLEAGR